MLFKTLLLGLVPSAFNTLALAKPCPKRGQDTNTTTTTPDTTLRGENSATCRACWKSDWNIYTDYESTIPTGTARTFDLTITNVTSFSPDGSPNKRALLINGQYPGPPIIADWGDYVEINVHNQLTDNGTSIHWHGLRQFQTSDQDGANGVTECPIPPGGSRTYKFRATQYGTSWYHSHFSVQYGNGVVGAIQINGPASANYDIDLGTYPVSDYYNITADLAQLKAEQAGTPPPRSNNVLFNGTNINPVGHGGAYSRVGLTPGKKHLLRIVNTSVENHLTLSLVGHNFTVVATDFVPVTPVNKSQIFVAVGQRYDIIIDASQSVGHYWFNATLSPDGLCGTSFNPSPAAIFSYEGAPGDLPTNTGPKISADCHDTTGFTPIINRTASQADWASNQEELQVALTTVASRRGNIFQWQVNSSSVDIQWDNPILKYVKDGNASYPTAANVISLDKSNVWTFWVIQNTGIAKIPHPIHLHGHDFLVLGSSETGTFDPAVDMPKLNFTNPTRRDVAMLPPGWLVIAFKTDNPGAWLMHCHIAWHVSQGLSVQFLERVSEIPKVLSLDHVGDNCEAWSKYQPTAYYPKIDSGL